MQPLFLKLLLLLHAATVARTTTTRSTVVPGPASLKSDLTILTDNDLYETQTPKHGAAILLSTAGDGRAAALSCQSLGETLVDPSSTRFDAGLNNSLSYQVYLENFSRSQLFWVGTSGSSSCRAIDVSGTIHNVPCSHALPALCTQSAPISNSTYTDTASRFHVSQQVGRLDLVGYRDLYSWRFFGVRYAPRPDRFAYSTVYEGAGSTSATQYGSDCLQAPGSGSEDCLFLNIWTPYLPPSSSVPKKRLKPVLLFIFGGGFVSGTANDPGADGGNIASRGDVVVVGIQYRLANLGWLALNDGVANGNYGLSDMITALQWVQQNIKAFGGDPARVTIQGESAGSSAVRALLASPKAKGLFAGAIMESDPGGAAPLGAYAAYGSVTVEYQAIAVPVLNATGCLSAVNQLACLRAVNGTELQTLRAQNAYPMMDNFFLPTDGLQLDGKGYAASVPLLIGTNRDEGGIDVQYLATDNETLALDTLAAIFSYNTSVIQSSGAFPNPSPKNVSLGIFNITARIVTDAGLRCNSQATAYSGSKYHVFPHVYTFEFNRTYQPALFDSSFCDPPKTAQFPLGDANLEYFKCHAGEVSYVFGNLLRLGQPDRDGLDVPFSQLAVDYWSSFVRTGNPNPATGYLEARGYWGTLAQVRKVGQWEAVGGQQAPVRELQWNGAQIPWQDLRQCAVLGYPVTMYE